MRPSRREAGRIALFLVSGLIAFGVDYLIFRLSMSFGAGSYVSKSISWMTAASTTFSFNTLFTFRAVRSTIGCAVPPHRLIQLKRYFQYIASQALGGAVNISTFLVLLHWLQPLSSLVVATLSATTCNYLGARFVLGRGNS